MPGTMKTVLLLVVLLTLVYLGTSTEAKVNLSQLQSCRRKVRANCRPNAKICVRVARSNLCQLRSYGCKQRLADCRAAANDNNSLATAIYQRVNRKLCSGNRINQSLPCANTNTNTNNNNNNNWNTPIIYA
ncbi:uncharacterized protein LOC115561851 [Drosophila navojoa]|uniref:uncharacterized protein LOC115561851 n=1 Tax=Drosophila navojoa TaxID=7232 RepID=UPI0011BD68FF|nr:uncharacterized protein LOC115561851 [Drosophila navojoa]